MPWRPATTNRWARTPQVPLVPLAPLGPLPSADELAVEVERYLREHGSDVGDDA